ncbi:MAG: tetratricopeptide repeat protein [Acidobacteriota bacterium]
METADRNPEPGSELAELLDAAGRAYMNADYPTAVGLWQQVLQVDGNNVRAREGIKKVEMLCPAENADDAPPITPVLEEIQILLDARRFDEAVAACRSHGDAASPALRTALRDLEQRAERARALEPEIRHALGAARLALKEGNARAAVPHLKQVLSLDRDHPLATRLMQAMRDRARTKAAPARVAAPEPPPPPPSPLSVEREVDEVDLGPLPASGRPGSDAPPLVEATEPAEPPASVGEGLPSSPPLEDTDEILPEFELETVTFDDPPETDEAPTPETMATGQDTAVPDGEEIIQDDVSVIDLEPEAATVPRSTHAGVTTESPFAVSESQSSASSAPAEGTRDDSGPAGAAREKATLDDDVVPKMAEIPGAAFPETDEEAVAAPVRRRSSRRAVLLAIAMLAVAGAVAAWWSGLLPTPTRPAVARPVPHPEVVKTRPPEARARPAPAADAAPGTPPVRRTLPEPQITHRDPTRALALFETGQDQFEAGQIDEAIASFEKAIQLDPMNAEIGAWMTKSIEAKESRDQLSTERAEAFAAFKNKNFAEALRKFYRLQENDPEGAYDRYITGSWFNWGLKLLAGGNLREASVKMDEVLGIDPDDADALKVKELIASYLTRPKDRVFFLRVEALRFRPLE